MNREQAIFSARAFAVCALVCAALATVSRGPYALFFGIVAGFALWAAWADLRDARR